MRHIFHLSIPVAEMGPAKRFYVDVLGAHIGREGEQWLDVLLWGHQITLQSRPSELTTRQDHSGWHFGVVLPWSEWEKEEQRLRAARVQFEAEPVVLEKGTSKEQAKMYLKDPSNNLIEIKAYRNVAGTLGLLDQTTPP